MVPQAGRHRVELRVLSDARFDLVEPPRLVHLSRGVGHMRLEEQEPGAYRSITVLEARENDLVLHLYHRSARRYQKTVGRRGAPRRIPSSSHAFTDRPRPINV